MTLSRNCVWALFVSIVTVQLTGATASAFTYAPVTNTAWSDESPTFMTCVFSLGFITGICTLSLLETLRRRLIIKRQSRSLQD